MDTLRKAVLMCGVGVVLLATGASVRFAKQRVEISRNLELEEVSVSHRLEIEKAIERVKISIEEREAEYSLARIEEREVGHRSVSGPVVSSEIVGASPVEAWLGRVDDLSRYLSINRSLRIPELEFLTPKHWLSATRGGALKTDADYRLAMAHLRTAGRLKSATKIRSALRAYQKENGGKLPSSPRELVAYSNDELSLAIMARYEMNYADEVPGLINRKRIEMVETNEPVDALFNSRFYFTDTGFGYSSPDSVEDSMKRIEAAMDRFEADHNRPPETSSEIEALVEDRESIEDLPSLFEAMTTPVVW